MAGHQVGADGRQSGEQEVHVEFYLAALPEDVCLGREQGRGRGGGSSLIFRFSLIPPVQSCLDTSAWVARARATNELRLPTAGFGSISLSFSKATAQLSPCSVPTWQKSWAC